MGNIDENMHMDDKYDGIEMMKEKVNIQGIC